VNSHPARPGLLDSHDVDVIDVEVIASTTHRGLEDHAEVRIHVEAGKVKVIRVISIITVGGREDVDEEIRNPVLTDPDVGCIAGLEGTYFRPKGQVDT